MRSLLCEGGGRVTLVEAPDPEPQSGDVLVRIEASAVCGSERNALDHGFAGNCGHEACGTVVDPGGSTFRAGDRVGIAAVFGCGECQRCLDGQELHCHRGPKVNMGWHAEFAAVPARTLRELPSGLDAGVGVMLTGDGLGVPARGLRRAPSNPDDRVLVIGLGPVGLGHVLVRAFIGAEVIAIEPSAYRRELALQLGATRVLHPDEDLDARPSLVIESTGRSECIRQALELVDNGGVVLQSGECHTDVAINTFETMIHREVTYTGSWYYATEDYQDMCLLLDRGIRLERLSTHDVAAADSQLAITDFLEGSSGKVILRWN